MYPLTGKVLQSEIARLKQRFREIKSANHHPYNNKEYKNSLLLELTQDLLGIQKDVDFLNGAKHKNTVEIIESLFNRGLISQEQRNLVINECKHG